MQNKQFEKYYLGLDIGTNSIGYAVTDEDYNIIFKNGKPLSGIRLFEEGKTAADRRVFRSNRRRLKRRFERIKLLQTLFAEEICQKDPSFFRRLAISNYHFEDKDEDFERFSLFADQDFNDIDFYNKYKTFYHLRLDLMENGTNDPRLLYLACHHIIKKRGHFLYEGQKFSEGELIENLFKDLNQIIEEREDFENFNFDISKIEEIKIAIINGKNSSAKIEKISEIFGIGKNKIIKLMIKGFCGQMINLKNIFNGNEEYKDFDSFDFSEWEKKENEITSLLSEQDFSLIIKLKEIYDVVILMKIKNGEEYISKSMIKIYEKHKSDLKLLKNFYQQFLPNDFNEMFRTMKVHFKGDKVVLATYGAYSGINKVRNQKQIIKNEKDKFLLNKSKVSQEEFLNSLRNQLKVFFIDDKFELGDRFKENFKAEFQEKIAKYSTMFQEIANGIFLPKILSTNNSLIPYQLNKMELEKILNKCKENFSFLLKSDEYGTVAEKIISILEFKIPYYIGPLNNHDKRFAWNIRFDGKKEKITPWNIYEIINKDASAEAFIKRMTNKCTYLKDEDVLPRNSIIYSKYVTLNILNTIRIKGEKLPKDIKNKVFVELFCKEKNITKAKLIAFLKKEGAKSLTKDDITGIDGDKFNNAMESLIILSKIFENQTEQFKSEMEKIIEWHTVFTEKDIIVRKIEEEFKDKFKEYFPNSCDNKIKELKRLKFVGWGKFSLKFLTGIKTTRKGDRAVLSILDVLEEESKSLNEIIYSEQFNPTFFEVIKNINSSKKSEVKIEEFDFSPAIRRAVNQSNLIVDEIVKIFGNNPEKVFVEVTRENDKSKKGKSTSSRQKYLLELYKNVKIEKEKIEELINVINKKSNMELRSEKLFLYFLQFGKCAYSGETIELSELSDGTKYDVDHIIPQSIKKDDSINNKVLVLKHYNQTIKKDIYPIPDSIRNNSLIRSIWETWKNAELISEEKYKRLIRNQELTPEELQEFIARQLVFTSQSTLKTIDFLEEKFNREKKQTQIIYSKAKLVSEFRQKFNLLKCREVNNLHHANDAYLNIVVGNVYQQIYGDLNRIKSIDKSEVNPLKLDKLFDINRSGIWMSGGYRDEKGDWHYNDFPKTIEIVKKNLNIKNLLESRMTYIQKGQLYDQTIYKKSSWLKNQKSEEEFLIPRKEGRNNSFSNTKKYGGFKKESGAYFVIAQSEIIKKKKNETIITLEVVTNRFYKRIENGEMTLEKYLEKEKNLINPVILYNKMKYGTVWEIGKSKLRISSISANTQINFINAVEWYPSFFAVDYIRTLTKYQTLIKENVLKDEDCFKEIYVTDNRKENKNKKIIDRDSNLKLYEEICNQLSKPLYERFSSFYKNGEVLKNKKDIFDSLHTNKQAFILVELIGLLQCNAGKADLRLIGESENTGSIRLSKKITDEVLENNIKIIEVSATGFFRKKVPIKIKSKVNV